MSELHGDPMPTDSNPTEHYNTVVHAWGELLGQNLHYGFFESANTDLATATEALTSQMLAAAKLQPNMNVIDVGCGTGKAACRMAEDFNADVVGISPSSECIDRANALTATIEGGGSASFQIGDGTKMAFEDESFDRVWVMESSHLMQDKPALLSECARVLRPGGKVVLCDIILKRKLPLERVIEYRDEFLLLRDAFGRAIMEPLTFYAATLESYGLHVELVRDISEETFSTFAHWRNNAKKNRTQVIE
ncbi:MAG: class I SAM-dependent methyltransferase, partial [Halioglobus sp.]